MKNFLPILTLLLVLALGGVFFFKKSNLQNENLGTQEPSTSSPLTSPPSSQNNEATNKKMNELADKDQEEIKKCFGSPAKNMDEFKALAEARTKLSKDEATLEWKNIHFTDNEGKKFRLRLEKEVSENGRISTHMKLFSVDAEDLPDLIKIPAKDALNPSDRTIQAYLEGKQITLEQEALTIPLTDGEMRLETENGKTISLELESQAVRASCSIKFQSSCRCFSAIH